jgi:hypothetical protein
VIAFFFLAKFMAGLKSSVQEGAAVMSTAEKMSNALFWHKVYLT